MKCLVDLSVFGPIVLYFGPPLSEQVNLVLFKFGHIGDSLLPSKQLQCIMSVDNLILHRNIVFVERRALTTPNVQTAPETMNAGLHWRQFFHHGIMRNERHMLVEEFIQLPHIKWVDRNIQLLHLGNLHEAFDVPAGTKLVALSARFWCRMVRVVHAHVRQFFVRVILELHHMI